MKLREYEGKGLFAAYGVPTPKGVLIESAETEPALPLPYVLKAQVRTGNRKANSGILFVRTADESKQALQRLFNTPVGGEIVASVLAEESVAYTAEYYISITYSTETRSPVLLLSARGGSGTDAAHLQPLSILQETIPQTLIDSACAHAELPQADVSGISDIAQKMWRLFLERDALLVEINPLFKTENGFVAGDAKIELEDAPSGERRVIDMQGDIAVLASGGGASMLNMDALIAAGGRPANYTEYSGNPPASVVKELTLRVLSKPGLKGCWVVGAFANFTDLFTTLSGFAEALKEISPKPTYPIVIRRDGPRREEAFNMLEALKSEGYDVHLFASETSMEQSAHIMVNLAYPV